MQMKLAKRIECPVTNASVPVSETPLILTEGKTPVTFQIDCSRCTHAESLRLLIIAFPAPKKQEKRQEQERGREAK